ncbi:MAG: histidine--tRNA ligase [Pseudomonadota bacterium]
MTETLRAVRGMNDVLMDETPTWQVVEDAARRVLDAYAYREIRLPVLEFTELFKRSIGEVTDIVEKEMYTFDDRNGESLTLRPEATAGVVRAAISNGLTHNQRHKVWTSGPMFRREKPQKGRYRQFYQIDVEAIGYQGPDVDAEMILMSARLFRELGLPNIELQLNTLGTAAARAVYRARLIDYFERYRGDLDDDAKRRLHSNPLRLLDSKNPALAGIIAEAPTLTADLDTESRDHFDALTALISDAGIAFVVNPRLVRGLDYYSRTVFEWVTTALGSQGAVLSGGRYDGLYEQLGGKSVPAIGWAAGVERLVGLYQACHEQKLAFQPHIYIVAVGQAALRYAMQLAERLRTAISGLSVEVNFDGGSFKSQLKRADKSGAPWALIIGENELNEQRFGLKPLRSDDGQQTVDETQLINLLTSLPMGGAMAMNQ